MRRRCDQEPQCDEDAASGLHGRSPWAVEGRLSASGAPRRMMRFARAKEKPTPKSTDMFTYIGSKSRRNGALSAGPPRWPTPEAPPSPDRKVPHDLRGSAFRSAQVLDSPAMDAQFR